MIDPLALFSNWLAEAKACADIREPTAMTLATTTLTGRPSARIVLLKEVDDRGFVFYTNLQSRKSEELKQNAQAALCFYWMQLDKQVRIEGKAERVEDAQAQTYFATRAREKQIGAWASAQSQILQNREELIRRVEEYTQKFGKNPIACPPFWGGWRIVPQRLEFWQQGEFRLHERQVFTRAAKGWVMEMLYP